MSDRQQRYEHLGDSSPDNEDYIEINIDDETVKFQIPESIDLSADELQSEILSALSEDKKEKPQNLITTAIETMATIQKSTFLHITHSISKNS